MKRAYHFFPATVAIIGIAATFTCCTAFGTYAGWRADRKNAQRDIHATPIDMSAIPSGYSVEVTLRDGKVLSGFYAGKTTVPDSTYAARYAGAQAALASVAALPPLDATLEVAKRSGHRFRIPFAGFYPTSMALRYSYSPPFGQLILEDVDTLTDISGNGYSPRTLRSLLDDHRLPLRTAIRIRWNGSPVTVPLEDVVEVHAGPVHTSNWAYGLTLGVIVDALIAGTILRSINK